MGKISLTSILLNNGKEKGKAIFNILQSAKVNHVQLETMEGYSWINNPEVIVTDAYDINWYGVVEMTGDIEDDSHVLMAFLHLDNGYIIELIVNDQDYIEGKEKALAAN